MKKIYLFIIFVTLTILGYSQSPQMFKYQAVLRDASGNILSNDTVDVEISILESDLTTVVFSEIYENIVTTTQGLVNLNIGSISDLSVVDWSNGEYFIEISINGTVMGTSQLLSVPYSLYANSADYNSLSNLPLLFDGDYNSLSNLPVINTDIYGFTDTTSLLFDKQWSSLTGTTPNISIFNNDAGFIISEVDGSITNEIELPDQTDNSGKYLQTNGTNPSWVSLSPITGAGSTNYVSKWSSAGTIANSMIQDNGTSLSINYPIQNNSQLFVYRQQQTANGDGQATIFGYRDRNTQNVGSSYGHVGCNTGVTGLSFWGDDYSFAVGGWNYNDFARTGGVIGGEIYGGYWGALGYKAANTSFYGVYGSNTYANGSGKLTEDKTGFGGGFFSNFVGSISQGEVIGQIVQGEKIASYTIGNSYYTGRNIELIETKDQVIPVYSVSSNSSKIYSDGTIQLKNGTVYVAFDKTFMNSKSGVPTITVSPMGECNGVYIESVDEKGFTIREINKGKSNVTVSYIIIADRTDASKTIIPEFILDKDFSNNLKNSFINDGYNLKSNTQPIWWNGSKIEFGELPASLNSSRR